MEAVSPAQFRETLGRFASGVVVVAVQAEGRTVGFTASAFSSVSLDPPLVLVCIGRDSSSYPSVAGAPLFGVSVLSDAQEWIARQIARHGVDRFEGVALRAAAPVPLVEGALAHLACRRFALHEAGDHAILVGAVLDAATWPSRRPLVHYARSFGGYAPPSSARASLSATDASAPRAQKEGST